jgi:hypothetical protein
MGGVLVVCLVVSLVALDAALLEVLVRLDELAIDEEGQVEGLRLDRRRRPRSPLPLALGDHEGLAGLLEHGLVGMAGDAGTFIFRRAVCIKKERGRQDQENHEQGESGLHRVLFTMSGL